MMMRLNTSGRIAGLCFVGLLFAQGASAELRRVEAVGIYGIKESMRTRVIPKDEAISRANWEGISRVALELIGESSGFTDPGESREDRDVGRQPSETDEVLAPIDGRAPDSSQPYERLGADAQDARLGLESPTQSQAAQLKKALGKDTLPYTRSYRILEDQGERPVLFDDSPGIATEYVIVVEVIVDVERVQDALQRAGLVSVVQKAGAGETLTLEVIGLGRYEALESLVAVLSGPLGATRVDTLEFERGRQVLAVAGPFGLEELATELGALADRRLVLRPLAVDPMFSRIRLSAKWFSDTPPLSEDDSSKDSIPRS